MTFVVRQERTAAIEPPTRKQPETREPISVKLLAGDGSGYLELHFLSKLAVKNEIRSKTAESMRQ